MEPLPAVSYFMLDRTTVTVLLHQFFCNPIAIRTDLFLYENASGIFISYACVLRRNHVIFFVRRKG